MNRNTVSTNIALNLHGVQGRSTERDRAIADKILKNDKRTGEEKNCDRDRGGEVFSANIQRLALCSSESRVSVWTGTYMQMTTMSLPRSTETGAEVHPDTDQFIRVEQGNATVETGLGSDAMNTAYKLRTSDGIFVPACTWHNIKNTGRGTLKLTSIYAPPHHKKCTVEE